MTANADGQGTLRPIFVGGSGRSGTTIVAQILGAHREYVMVPIEVRFIVDRRGICDLVAGRCDLDEFSRLVSGPWWRRTLRDGHDRGLYRTVERATLDAAIERLAGDLAVDRVAAGRRFVHELLDPVAARGSARGWVEMTPPNVARGLELRNLFPGMRLVHSRRDGRDVAASVTRQMWGPTDPFVALDWWYERMLEAHSACQGLAGDELLNVSMEQLIRRRDDPDGPLAQLFRFVGLDVAPEVRRFLSERIDDLKSVSTWRDSVAPEHHDRFEWAHRAYVDRLRGAGVTAIDRAG